MTRVLSPVLPETCPHTKATGLEARDLPALPKQDSRDYLADMLKELSNIAAWADLHRVRTFIDAALYEVERDKNN
jgi:hypothetical protein